MGVFLVYYANHDYTVVGVCSTNKKALDLINTLFFRRGMVGTRADYFIEYRVVDE
jgi:hypothetical protein